MVLGVPVVDGDGGLVTVAEVEGVEGCGDCVAALNDAANQSSAAPPDCDDVEDEEDVLIDASEGDNG